MSSTNTSIVDGSGSMSALLIEQVTSHMKAGNGVHFLSEAAQLCNPCALLWVLIPFHLLLGKKDLPPSNGRLDGFKIALTLLIILIHSWRTSQEHLQASPLMNLNHNGYLSFMWSPTGTYILVLVLTMLARQRISNMRVPVFVFWCAALLSTVVNLYPRYNHEELMHVEDTLMDILHILVMITQCTLFFIERKASKSIENTHDNVHPQNNASWYSDCLLMWTMDLIRVGAKRNLEESDVYDLPEEDKCHNAISTFERSWKIEEYKRDIDKAAVIETTNEENKRKVETPKSVPEYEKKDKKEESNALPMSLLKVLIKTFGFKFFLLQSIKGIAELTFLVSPILMGAFMEFIQNRDQEHWLKGFGLVFAIFAFKSINEIFHHRIWATINRTQKRIRSSIMLCVFRKALTMKNDCAKDLTTGEIVNLISDDCDRVINMSQHMFFIISTPLMIIMSLYLLYRQVGDAMYVGLLIIILLIPLNKIVGNKMKNVHLKISDTREKRSKLMNEIINGIKVLKLYAWEPSFIQKVQEIRNVENECNNDKSIMYACIDSMFRAIPYLVKLGAFGAYLLLGGHIDAAKGFTTMHLFHLLNHPFSLMALLIPGYVEAAVSMKRINKFLNGENIPRDIVVQRRKGESAITIDNGTFSWERDSAKPTLRDINVNIPKGGLVAVVGMVGSGKSSLLSAMLGEMEKSDGDVEVQGSVAYVPQEAWILNASLKDNVLFGSTLVPCRYKQVVNACSLKHDINLMTAGDKTEIGEKGINLSGGQKQRVSLARAVYSDADVYLLDDPLSAVDAHVGKHIFNKVIGPTGVLKEKTRVLVTHGIHWLPFVDSILYVKDGTVVESGTYEQLTAHDGALAQFLKEVLSHKTDESSDKVNKLKQNMMNRLNSVNAEHGELTHSDPLKTKEPQNGDGLSDSSSSESSEGSDDDSECLETSQDNGNSDQSAAFIDEEDMEQGQVSKGIYLEYIRAVGYKLVVLFAFVFCMTSIFDVVNTNVVKEWTDDPLLSNTSLSATKEYEQVNWTYFQSFAITGAIEVVSSFIYVFVIVRGTFQAATRLHNKLLYRVLRSPISFFDTTPTCRIITRFTKDVTRVDELGGCLRGLICQFFNMCTFLTLIVVYSPAVGVYLAPISVAYFLLFRLHVGSMRQLRRYRSKYRSPMYTHFTETLNGLASIRAFNSQTRFIKAMEDKIDNFTKFELWELWVGLGFGMRLNLLCNLVGLAAGLVSVFDASMTAGMVGIVAIYAEHFSGTLGGFLRLLSHTETELISLERVMEYSNKPSEAEWELEDKKPVTEWPDSGHVVFENYQTRYREGHDLILKGVSCRIEGGQKIGIVGRTGAGKSTLTMAFFRLLEAVNGNIVLDEENIANLGLHDLRSRINILPQDPVVFSGSLRMNLDPFGRSTDGEIWEALRHSHLASFVEGLTGKLDFECGEGGKNMSVGQRQLLCLARTLLRRSKILVLDEATAAVDMETDELIQKTIRTEFKDCTVLTIAHRLNTIMDYDKILVLDRGQVEEFDSPSHLLADKSSTFYSMAKDANLVE